MDHHSASDDVAYAHDVLSTLLEAALRDQKLTRDAIKTMNRVSNDLAEQGRRLPASVSAEVNKDLREAVDVAAEILTKRIKDANVQADEAAQAFRRAARQAGLFIFAPALVVTAMTMALWYELTAHSISRLENQRAELQRTVDILSSHGGRLSVSNCKLPSGQTVTCIRVGNEEYGNGYHIPFWEK
ncbi:hypothetical protein AYM40_06605 [Paraburkholderia phytofirmans OLGA172]|uniref:Mobilization protein n=1 Tax=Paraburkholderia phytofirmans OLGA172 TaxID=1417228 RepID=A0A160FJH6_9BURK|nr:hypothetical protein [Paraburkholderia phytofirmans]ANB72078.1 hypothetical protein AYM40_06605 [Paraburkholderia phytofirmans OLGA172]